MDEALSKAKAYSRAKYYLVIAETILYIGFFIILQLSGLSSYMAEAASHLARVSYLTFILYISILGLLLTIIDFPLEFLSSFKIEHRFGLSKQDFPSWFNDYIKRLIVSAFLFIIMVVILYYFLRISVSYWWLYVALAYFFLSVVLAKIFPVIIIPLFYKLNKIKDTPLKGRLISLTKKAGVKVLDVYKVGLGEKTKKANAALCGWGATKRILLSDTLLQKYTEDEIESTLAHELAHYKNRHFWKLNLYNFIFTLVGFGIINIFLQRAVRVGYIKQIYDIRVFPILAMLFISYSILITPLYNYISRRYESEADSQALSLMKNPAAFANLIRKLTLQNLSDPQPEPLIKFFFYDHPPAQERIRACNNKIGKRPPPSQQA